VRIWEEPVERGRETAESEARRLSEGKKLDWISSVTVEVELGKRRA